MLRSLRPSPRCVEHFARGDARPRTRDETVVHAIDPRSPSDQPALNSSGSCNARDWLGGRFGVDATP